jgi:serine/threonine protein kinase
MSGLIGRHIDNYRVDALLGEGGMGAVYRAYDVNLARPEFQRRFLQEAQAAAKLDHSLPGSAVGTLPYMSPEQFQGVELDGRSDLYSLGIMLYELTTGRLPFAVSSFSDAHHKHRNEPPPPPGNFRPGLPQTVITIIERSLAKEPNMRYQSGETLASDLRQAASGHIGSDINRFSGTYQVTRLATQLISSGVQMPSQRGSLLPGIPGQAQIVVAQAGASPYTVSLDKDQMTIGRGFNCDLILNGAGVSRQHVRLERMFISRLNFAVMVVAQ